jgi:hypothetical protein
MRLAAMALGAGLLLSACSMQGTTTTSATSGGVATTTAGASTTGGSGTTSGSGTSTGGTTTGGGLTPGAACTANGQCLSGVCGINGSGHCCHTACSTTDATCGATACDATGACTYPTGTACGTSCNGNMLTAKACNASGACTPGAPTPCPNHLACNSSATACVTTCVDRTGCVSGYYCNGGSCAVPQATGPCTTNDACTSGICGVTGSGHCCTTTCSTTDVTCGASDCNGTGACVYPNNTTPCGAGSSCTGHTQTNATTCDGNGSCAVPQIKDCSPYGCGATACFTTCTDATSCTPGAFCDNSACCSLTKFGSMSVDGLLGSDTAGCCGIGTNAPCQTITKAMVLIDKAKVSSVTITATIDGGGGDWNPDAGEKYPIVLGWGVELKAPGVFFLDPATSPNGPPSTSIFDVNFYSPKDTVGFASIVGSAASPVGVGMNAANNAQTDDNSVIAVEASNTLYIANASVNGSDMNPDQQQAFLVTQGASLTLGQDQSGLITGTVHIGNALGNLATDGYSGIICGSDNVSLGCTIQDAPLLGQSALVIQGQHNIDIDAEDFANISLTASPVIGVPPSAAGFLNCPQKDDGAGSTVGIKVNGAVTFTFKNGIVQCIVGPAFQLLANGNHQPTLTLDSTTIQNTDLGIYASAGTATVTNSTLHHNAVGVQQDTDGMNNGAIDLGGGGNTVVCSSNVERVGLSGLNPGVDVFNSSTAVLKADKVTWDTAGPDYFQCDSSGSTCSCNHASCTTSAGSDDMDAVEVGDAGITTTGNVKFDGGCK